MYLTESHVGQWEWLKVHWELKELVKVLKCVLLALDSSHLCLLGGQTHL